MILALFGSLLNFAKEFLKTFIIDTMVGFLLRPVGL